LFTRKKRITRPITAKGAGVSGRGKESETEDKVTRLGGVMKKKKKGVGKRYMSGRSRATVRHGFLYGSLQWIETRTSKTGETTPSARGKRKPKELKELREPDNVK